MVTMSDGILQSLIWQRRTHASASADPEILRKAWQQLQRRLWALNVLDAAAKRSSR